MPNTLQEFLADMTQKQSDNLIAAFLRLPDDKRAWSPEGKARTAMSQVVECALLNGHTATLIETRAWAGSMEDYFREQAQAEAQGWDVMHPLLQANTAKVIAAIRATPTDALGIEVDMPWGKQTLDSILAYPYWNMTYHEGQINYIASMLGCLP